ALALQPRTAPPPPPPPSPRWALGCVDSPPMNRRPGLGWAAERGGCGDSGWSKGEGESWGPTPRAALWPPSRWRLLYAQPWRPLVRRALRACTGGLGLARSCIDDQLYRPGSLNTRVAISLLMAGCRIVLPSGSKEGARQAPE